MKLPRRKFLHLLAGAAALLPGSRIAKAQSYPSRPVRIICGYPPGGSNDLYARLVAQWLSERLGQQFFVDNRSGAGGNLATEMATKSAPDGYTLLLASSGDAWSGSLYGTLKFNFIRDMVPVATIARGMGALVVNPGMPVKSVVELIDYAKANPGKVRMASSGVGSAPHMYWELFRATTGVDMLHVPYRGAGPALIDLLSGQVDSFIPTLVSAIEHIRAEKLRILAVTGAKRAEVLPNVPTVGEFVPGYDASIWWGLAVPKDTPAGVVSRLNEEIGIGLQDARIKTRIAELGDAPFVTTPSEFRTVVSEDTDKWAKVIRAANIKAE
jgi:tripartite-type tricarboxylate transporter receptor subunit TctC